MTFFCRATDLEAILALEVRETNAGELAWHYAAANFTRGGIAFLLDDKEVWSEESFRDGSKWFNPEYKHYGGFPFQGFTLAEGIARQKAHLDD